MSKQTRVIVAESSELPRKALIALLRTNNEFEVPGEASDGRALMEQLKRTKADVVLMDSEMPVIDSKATLELICRRFPDVKVVILSSSSDPGLQSDFMVKGAASFLYKNISAEILFKALRHVKAEGYFLNDSTSKALLEVMVKEKKQQAVSPEICFNDRETEVLRGICDGKTNRELALLLHLSASTIDFYRTRIYFKTKCHNITELLKFALKNGIIAIS